MRATRQEIVNGSKYRHLRNLSRECVVEIRTERWMGWITLRDMLKNEHMHKKLKETTSYDKIWAEF